MPYAAKIQEREEEREREIKSKGGPPINGFVAHDLLGAIKLNQSSIPALSRDLRVPHSVIEKLVQRLVKAGRITVRRSKRSLYVRLASAEQPLGEGAHGPSEESPE